MKAKFITLFVFSCIPLLTTIVSAQGVWELQNPVPTSEYLEDIFCMPNTTQAWAVGANGTVLKSVDGNTWTKVNSGTTSHLESVYFFDSNTGWAAGVDGTIIKTTNGGYSWTTQISHATNPLRRIQFANINVGWAIGDETYFNRSVIVKTADGGNNWTALTIEGYQIWDCYFSNSNIGWAVGTSGTILKTTDGGTNWVPQVSGTAYTFYGVFFIDSNTGWAVGDLGMVYKTTNGGTSWIGYTTPTTNVLFGIYMINSSIGWAVGNYGSLLKTTNGGTIWTAQTSGTTNSLYGIKFSNSSNGWAVGVNGIIIRSIDGGSSWSSLTSGTLLELRNVCFIDANTGFAIGGAYSVSGSGIVLKTVNGGNSWTVLINNYSYGFYGVDFLNSNTGWVVGEHGTILKTINGGTSWTSQTSGTAELLQDVDFYDSLTGWSVGGPGIIIKTTDGGTTWTPQTSGTTNWLYGLFFTNINIGYVITSSGTVLKTINGGTTWTPYAAGGNRLNCIYFADANTGWTVGAFGTIRKTINGGTTWTPQTSINTDYFNGVYFTDVNNGWAVGSYGKIFRTSDGGTTWNPETSGTSSHLNKVQFIDSKNGYAVGASGAILHYTNYSPAIQASNLTINSPTYQSVNVSWTRGNGNQAALFAKQVTSGTCIPEVNATYLPNSTFGSGDQIGNSGWYCVYNGSGTSVNVNGLLPSTAYRFQVCEYNFSSDFTHYNSTSATNNPITVTTAIAPPQITTSPGNVTLCENLNATFSATASGSGLTYQWQVDAGSGYLNVTNSGIYSGSTTSTLSLTGIPANLNANKYHCVVSNTSGNATSNEAVLTVNPLPVNPSDVSGNQVVCLNSSYLYILPPVQYSTSYTWTYPTGFSGNSTINNITLVTASDAVAGNITVKGINACGSGPVRNFTVSVQKLPGSATQITGLNNVCTGSINTGYNTAIIADADYYIWSLPFEATGSSTTNSIMVNYGSNPLTGQITVKGHNICGDGPQSVLPVSVNTVPAAIGAISGSSNVCRNEKNLLYTINPIPNATSYTWTLPTGITGSNSTNSVSLSIGPDAFSGDLKVSGVNSCGLGTTITFPLIVDAVPDAPGPVSGPSTVCRGTSNIQYSVTKSERATSYSWELPDGTTETTLVNKIALNFDNNAVSGYLSVSPNNSCGSGNSSTAFIEVSVPSKPEINPENYKGGTCMADTPLRLSVIQPLAGYSYLWYKNGKLYNNSNSTFLEDFLSSGDYSVEANLNGCKVQSEVFNVYYPDAPAKPSIYVHGPKVWYLACSNNKARDYKWYYNGDLITGADKYIYVANKKLGDYYVTISNDAGCYTSSDVMKIPVDGMSIEETDPFAGLTIYPNPNSGQFTIETNNKLFGDVTISVLDPRGSEVFRSKSEKTSEKFSSQIILRNQSRGIYFVNLRINGLDTKRKIIIE